MATLGRRPGAAPLTSADIPDNSITGAKIVDNALDSEHYTDGSIDTAHVGANQVTAALVAADVATQAELDAAVYDDNKIQTNIALLAFKTAVNGSLAKYNLQDQVIDEYAHVSDISGIDDGPSTNYLLASGSYSGDLSGSFTSVGHASTGVTDGYTWYKWLTFTTIGVNNIDYLVVAGGGGGARGSGGGGGAGGFKTAASFSISAQEYTITVGGGGGAASGNSNGGKGGNSSIGSTILSTGGGGGGGRGQTAGGDGGSGGGGSGYPDSGTSTGGPANPVGQGNDGADGTWTNASNTRGGGGGGAANGGSSVTGGVGENNIMAMDNDDSYTFSTAVSAGHNVSSVRYYAGGGGAGSEGFSPGDSSNGGGGAGGLYPESSNPDAQPGINGTGGGGGGGYQTSAVGGSGIVLIRHLTLGIEDLILQSTDTVAEAEPDYADMVMLVEDAGNLVGTENTHIKGWVSRDSGTTFTQGTLVDEGDWGTDKRILAFHDLDISGQPTGGSGDTTKSMCYKITTHSASAVYNTKIHATSIGWR